MKIVKIRNCNLCPYRAVYPNFDNVLRVPYCNHHDTGSDSILPHALVSKSAEPSAIGTHVIPEWCPLENGE